MSNASNGFRFANPAHNLAYAIRTAAALAALPVLSQSSDWRVSAAARAVESDLRQASEAGEDGYVYRQKAMRGVVGLCARLPR